jgi:Asp-tRNA(Asn)/Glu-tRNA(Gln) amidotransferase A subunit family amidase
MRPPPPDGLPAVSSDLIAACAAVAAELSALTPQVEAALARLAAVQAALEAVVRCDHDRARLWCDAEQADARLAMLYELSGIQAAWDVCDRLGLALPGC